MVGRWVRLVLAAAVIIIAPLERPLIAEEWTTGDVANDCRSALQIWDDTIAKRGDKDLLVGGSTAMRCVKYLEGISIGYLLGMGPATGKDLPTKGLFCIPSGVSGQQKTRVLVRWAEMHPEKLYLPAYAGVFSAFGEAWPCGEPLESSE